MKGVSLETVRLFFYVRSVGVNYLCILSWCEQYYGNFLIAHS